MLYNSFEFIFIFLPICLAVYYLSARLSRGLANALLVVASLVFYAYWDWDRVLKSWPHFSLADSNLALILLSITGNYVIGALVRRFPKKWILTIGVTANLSALAYFKYANFALFNWDTLTGQTFAPLQIVLPLGISFFTFTQIAFLVDAYKGAARELDFFRYCLFVVFFPHLIAGPIVHHSEIMPQFALADSKKWQPNNIHIGIAFFTLGLCKKVIIADTCGPWANGVFDSTAAVHFFDAWRGAIAYTMQLYFDFSGYSDMAIGLSMLFNVRLPDNFDSPYRSVNIVDFWRRWHITLSRFLRDYLYIPLGGNRKGEGRRQLNLMVTMLLGGFWHGAGWTYIIWGGYHGVLLVVNHLWAKRRTPLPSPLARVLTFVAVVVGWVFFRSNSVDRAWHLLKSMAGISSFGQKLLVSFDVSGYQMLFLAVLVGFVNVMPTTKQWVEARPLGFRRALVLGCLFFLCLLWMRNALLISAPSQFIYFQF